VLSVCPRCVRGGFLLGRYSSPGDVARAPLSIGWRFQSSLDKLLPLAAGQTVVGRGFQRDVETDGGHHEVVEGDQLLGMILQECAAGLRRRLAPG